MQITNAFQQSYRDFERYPQNLLNQPLYDGAAVAYKTQLRDKEPTLLQPETNDKIEIRFRDIESSIPKKRTVINDQELKEWLGDTSTTGPNGPSGALITREDPKCRFIFLLAPDSRSQLQVTRKSLLRLLSYHQVAPEYINFLSVFGLQEGPADPLFSSFCGQTRISKPIGGLNMQQIGRSGRQFQLCYNIKAPAWVSTESQWSIRQAAIHHQFDIEYGTSLWLITRGGLDIYEKIRNLTDQFGRPEDRDVSNPKASFRATLSIHMLHAFWALEKWKPYVSHLETMIKEKTGLAIHGERSQASERHEFSPDELRSIQMLEDQITLAIAVLEGNMRVLTALSNYYQQLLTNSDFTSRLSCQEHVEAFTQELDDFTTKLDIEYTKAKFLGTTISNRKGLVLQYIQNQESEKTESLTLSMRLIALKSHRDTVAMSIITVVTLVYLPGTFVSAFFSTDVVKYQDTDSGSYSPMAMLRWAQVTVPLTVVTLVLAAAWFKVRDKQKEQTELPFYTMEKC